MVSHTLHIWRRCWHEWTLLLCLWPCKSAIKMPNFYKDVKFAQKPHTKYETLGWHDKMARMCQEQCAMYLWNPCSWTVYTWDTLRFKVISIFCKQIYIIQKKSIYWGLYVSWTPQNVCIFKFEIKWNKLAFKQKFGHVQFAAGIHTHSKAIN